VGCQFFLRQPQFLAAAAYAGANVVCTGHTRIIVG
jgi:hypothetical protein